MARHGGLNTRVVVVGGGGVCVYYGAIIIGRFDRQSLPFSYHTGHRRVGI